MVNFKNLTYRDEECIVYFSSVVTGDWWSRLLLNRLTGDELDSWLLVDTKQACQVLYFLFS